MKDVFPILNKMPFLLPVMWAVRWFKILIFKPNNIKRQKQRIENSTNKEVEKYISVIESLLPKEYEIVEAIDKNRQMSHSVLMKNKNHG